MNIETICSANTSLSTIRSMLGVVDAGDAHSHLGSAHHHYVAVFQPHGLEYLYKFAASKDMNRLE